MPRSTQPKTGQSQNHENFSVKPLGNIGLVQSQAKLAQLQSITRGLTKNGKEILKGLQTCGNWNSHTAGPIEFVGYKGGRVKISNIQTCKTPDCPMCGNGVSTKKTKKLSKALQEVKMQGGEVLFLTSTARPKPDSQEGIEMILEFNRSVNIIVNNYTRSYEDIDKGLMYGGIEGTYSSGFCDKDYDGNKVPKFLYIHTHSHICIGLSAKAVKEKGVRPLVERIKEKWKKTCEKFSFYSQLDPKPKQNSDLSVTKSRSMIYDSVGFQCEYADNEEQISRYLNKIVESHTISAEMNNGHNKSGKGYTLSRLLELMILNQDNPRIQGHVKHVRTWFKTLYRRSRQVGYGLKRYIEMFEERQERYIKNYVKKHTTGHADYIESLRHHMRTTKGEQPLRALKEFGWSHYMREDSLSFEPITQELLDREEVVYREKVDPKLYNKLRKIGAEDTLVELFKEYYYHQRGTICYNTYMELNVRFNEGVFHRFIRECKTYNILKGTKYITKTYTEVEHG